jgi:hypothetical protein
MDGVGRGFPPGDLRVSDADRDRALAELSEAFRVGRITADEFDQRSGQAQRARTGKELTALLADLPLDGRPRDRRHRPGTSQSRLLRPGRHGRVRPLRRLPRRQGDNRRRKPRRGLGRRHTSTSRNRCTAGRADHLPARHSRRPLLASGRGRAFSLGHATGTTADHELSEDDGASRGASRSSQPPAYGPRWPHREPHRPGFSVLVPAVRLHRGP